MLARLLDANARFLGSARGFHLAAFAVVVGFLFLRAFLFPAAERDDAEQILFAQSFAWGYAPGKAPLYTWLVIVAQAAFGIGIFAVELVKFVLLALLYVLIYRAARRVLAERRLAAYAALSPLLLYTVAWDSTLNYSHTVLLMSVCMATFLALLWLESKGGALPYAVLGIAIGLGFLAKYNYGLFVAALALAALAAPAWRARLAHPFALVTLALAALIVAPHAVWAVGEAEAIGGVVATKLTTREALSPLEVRGQTLYELAKAAFNFASPLLVLLPVLFARGFARLPGGTDNASRRLLGRHLLALGGLAAGAALVYGASDLRNHYMAVFILFPLYAFARIEAAGFRPWALKAYAALVPLSALAVAGALIGSAAIGPKTCGKCRLHLDYGVLAEAVRAAGFANGTILASFHRNPIAGNLRLAFPDARVISTEYPRYRPPFGTEPGACLLVWQPEEEMRYGVDMRGSALVFLEARIPLAAPAGRIEVPVTGAPGRSFAFEYRLWPEGSGACR